MASGVRRWTTGVGMAGGAAIAAAMIGAATAPAAGADTSTVGDVLGQAVADLSQYDYSQLFNPDNPSLSSVFEVIDQGFFIIGQAAAQEFDADLVPAADQTNPLLLDAADELLNADQALLTSDATTPAALFANDLLVQDAAHNMSAVIFAELVDAGVANIGSDVASTADTADAVAAASTTTDTADELLSHAGTDLAQADHKLDSVPTASLDAKEVSALDTQEMLQTGPATQILTLSQSAQDGLPAADQTNLLLVDADQTLLTAYQDMLSADEGFLSVVQAGEPLSLTTELPTIEADLAVLGASFDVGVADYVAMFDPSLLTAF